MNTDDLPIHFSSAILRELIAVVEQVHPSVRSLGDVALVVLARAELNRRVQCAAAEERLRAIAPGMNEPEKPSEPVEFPPGFFEIDEN